jgi:hypothetical protein
MSFEFLVKDLNSPKSIGTDKGLAIIGDEIVNLAYSLAKSFYLTEKDSSKIHRTGLKVSKKILSKALINADMKYFAKNRADAHDLSNTVEALIAYVFLTNKMTLYEMVEFLKTNLSGNIHIRSIEIINATYAFTSLLMYIKNYFPQE